MTKFKKSPQITDDTLMNPHPADSTTAQTQEESQSTPREDVEQNTTGATQAEQSTQPQPNSHAIELNATITELTSDLQRTRADFENFRKQTELQKKQSMSIAKQSTIVKILPLIDDFERALSTYPEQLSPLQKSFDKTLQALGLTKINSEPGVTFNPDFHEAVSVDGDGDTEVIAETLRPGYLYDGAVIRAAMVKVQNS